MDEEGILKVMLLETLAHCSARTGDLTTAIDSLKQALKISPKDTWLNYNLGHYYAAAGDKNRAEEQLAILDAAAKKDSKYTVYANCVRKAIAKKWPDFGQGNTAPQPKSNDQNQPAE